MRPIATVAALLGLVCLFVMGCVECTIDAGETRVVGSGRVVEVERGISGVTGVHLSTFGDLKITIGEHERFVIEAEDNLVDLIRTEVTRGVLEVGTLRHYSLKPSKKVRYFLTVKELDTVIISSSGDIFAPAIDAEDFDIRLSSSGDLVVKSIDAGEISIRLSSSGDADIGRIDAREIDVGITSSGDITIDGGSTGSQDIQISSSGDYNAADVASKNARVRLSSSGDAHIHVDGELTVSLSSSGSVYYSGDASATVSATSSGRLRHLAK